MQLISQLERFQVLGLPVHLGPSRKSFIGKITGKDVSNRDYGTAAVCAVAVMKKASILRIHQIGAIRDTVRVAEAIQGGENVGTFQMGKY